MRWADDGDDLVRSILSGMFLYKYTSAARTDILRNLRLRFTQPADLNDPFEVLPRFGESSGDTTDLVEQVERQVALFFEAAIGSETIDDAVAAVAARLPHFGATQAERESLVAAIVAILPSRDRLEFGLHIQERFGATLGILSMSAVPDSLLMWAHYGDSHRGFALELDASHNFFARGVAGGYIGAPKPVDYDIRRPAFVLPDDQDADWLNTYLTRLLLTKSPEWSYEQEWRMLLPLDDQALYPHNVLGRNHLFDIPADAICAIILGNRCAPSTRGEIIDAVRSNTALSHVQLRYAHIHPDHFAVQITRSAWPTFPPFEPA